MEKNGYIIEPPEPNGSKTAEISLEAKVPKVSTSVVQMEKPYYSSIKNARGSKGVSSNDNWRKKSVMANDEDPERHHAARKNEKKIEFGRKEKVVRCSESRLGEQPSVLLENGIEPNLFSGTEVKNSSSLQSATPSSTSLDIQTNTSSSSRPKKCSNERYVDTSNELFKDTLDDVRLKKRTIIITNIPSDLSAEERKDVETPYVSLLHGGGGTASRWISPSTCFIVFVSEALCQRALDRAVRRHSNTHISWPQLFIDSLEFDTPENVQGMNHSSFFLLILICDFYYFHNSHSRAL